MTMRSPSGSEADKEVVYVPVPRSVLAAVPEWVSESTVQRVFGLDPERFVRACKANKIEGARKDGQLWLAPVADVRGYLRSLPGPGRARKAQASSATPADTEFEALELPRRVRRV